MTDLLSNEFCEDRFRRHRDDNVIPLINVVFLLLVFYMIAGQITDTYGRHVEPPVSGSEKFLGHPSIVLVLESDHSLSINGEYVELESLDAAMLGQTGAQRGTVVVKADKEVKAAGLDRLLNVLREHHVATITLYSKPAKQE